MRIFHLSKNTLFCSVTIIFTLLMSYQLYQATTWGAGLSTDSITYLEGARSILKNWNLEDIGTHYPPLYFILIAVTGLITGNALDALKTLQLITLAISFIIYALIVWKMTNKSFFPAIICLLPFVTSQSVLYVYSMAWSEGVFCLFALLGFYFLASYLEKENNKLYILAFSALAISFAFLTRYVGITLIGTGIITLAFYSSQDIKKRLTDSLFFSFFSMTPIFLWIGRNWLVSNAPTSRHLAIHPVSLDQVKAGIQVLLNWLFIPKNFSFTLLLTVLCIALIYIQCTKYTKRQYINRTFEICSIFIFTYLPFLLISISLFDAHTPLSSRILFPIYLLFFIALGALSFRAYTTRRIQLAGYLLFFLLLILSYAQLERQQQYLLFAKTNGIGFADKIWTESETLHWVEQLPPDCIIYTNAPDAITIIAHRSSKMVPVLISPLDRNTNTHFPRDIKKMKSEISEHNGVIVYLKRITWRWYLPTLKQLSQQLPLELLYMGKDGIVVSLKNQTQEDQHNPASARH